jgi:hypothetical protein
MNNPFMIQILFHKPYSEMHLTILLKKYKENKYLFMSTLKIYSFTKYFLLQISQPIAQPSK